MAGSVMAPTSAPAGLFRELRLEQASTVMVCGCGHSNRYPLCDGSHAKPAGTRRWWKWWA